MNLYTVNKGKDKITFYKLGTCDVTKTVLKRAYKPTIVRKESCLEGEEDQLFYQGDDVYYTTLESSEYLGRTLQSNIGVACNGCDHYYEDSYRYHYTKHFLVPELASAIRSYYAVRDLDVTKARFYLNKICDCVTCDTADLLMMFSILDALSFSETRVLENLDEFAQSVLRSNGYDCQYHLRSYREEIKGLTIQDICSLDSTSSYVLSRLRGELQASDKVQELVQFMPEIVEKRKELSLRFEECRKRKGYC